MSIAQTWSKHGYDHSVHGDEEEHIDKGEEEITFEGQRELFRELFGDEDDFTNFDFNDFEGDKDRGSSAGSASSNWRDFEGSVNTVAGIKIEPAIEVWKEDSKAAWGKASTVNKRAKVFDYQRSMMVEGGRARRTSEPPMSIFDDLKFWPTRVRTLTVQEVRDRIYRNPAELFFVTNPESGFFDMKGLPIEVRQRIYAEYIKVYMAGLVPLRKSLELARQYPTHPGGYYAKLGEDNFMVVDRVPLQAVDRAIRGEVQTQLCQLVRHYANVDFSINGTQSFGIEEGLMAMGPHHAKEIAMLGSVRPDSLRLDLLGDAMLTTHAVKLALVAMLNCRPLRR